MLDLMRKHAKNWLMKLLLGIIIVVFVFYFGSLRERDSANSIASIDGKVISYGDYQQEYEKLIEVYRSNLGGNLTEELLKSLRLKEQAVDNLIKQAIVLQQAEAMNIHASDEEVQEAILSYPAFQHNGVFDQRAYEQILRQNKMTPDMFETLQRNMLVTKKIQNLLISGIHVADREVFDLYRFQNEKINVQFLKLVSRDYRGDVKPTREALETYLKEHGKELRVPDQIQVKYLTFLGSDFASQAKVTDDEIREYYERGKERLTKSGGKIPPISDVREQIAAQLRQIAGMRLAADEAKKAHDAIYQQENFDAVAKTKALKVRLSPLFPANSLPPELKTLNDFAKNVFSLQQNEISRVLSDDKGYYLFQIAARKPSYIPTLKEAGAEIEDRYIAAEARILCQKTAENLLGRLKKGENLEQVAKEKKTKIGETGFFLPGANVPELGVSQQLTDSLAQLSETKPYPDKVLTGGDNFFIVRFKGRGKLDETDFQAKKDELKKNFAELKKREAINLWVDGLKNSLIKQGRLKIVKDMKDI